MEETRNYEEVVTETNKTTTELVPTYEDRYEVEESTESNKGSALGSMILVGGAVATGYLMWKAGSWAFGKIKEAKAKKAVGSENSETVTVENANGGVVAEVEKPKEPAKEEADKKSKK